MSEKVHRKKKTKWHRWNKQHLWVPTKVSIELCSSLTWHVFCIRTV